MRGISAKCLTLCLCYTALGELRSSLLYGASLLRRTLLPSPPSPPPQSPGPLYKKVAGLNLNAPSLHTVGGVVAPRPVPPSPLLHLSNLIRGTTPMVPYSDYDPCPSDLPSPDLPSPGTRRPPLPHNAPLGVPAQPGMGQLDSLRAPKAGAPRRDLGMVARLPSTGGGEKMGSLGVMTVGRKGGLL